MISRGQYVYGLVGNHLMIAASDDLAQDLDVNAIGPFVLLGPSGEGEPDDVESLTRELAAPIDVGAHRQARAKALRESAEHPNPWVRATVERILETSAIK